MSWCSSFVFQFHDLRLLLQYATCTQTVFGLTEKKMLNGSWKLSQNGPTHHSFNKPFYIPKYYNVSAEHFQYQPSHIGKCTTCQLELILISGRENMFGLPVVLTEDWRCFGSWNTGRCKRFIRLVSDVYRPGSATHSVWGRRNRAAEEWSWPNTLRH